MAFGKDQGHLGNVPSFGGNFVQRAKTQARRPARKGGGGGFYWKNTYKPPEHQPDIIRLIPGDYTVAISHDGESVVQEQMTYVPFKEHHNGQRGGICSAGPLWGSKQNAQPCPSCVIFWEDVNERKAKKARGDQTRGPNRMSCRDQFAFNVFDYGMYFEIPDTDRNGQMRMNQKTNQPYTSWVKGNANDPQFAGKPWKQGQLLAWPMGGTYKDTLIEWAKKIGQSCKGCGSMGSIRTTMKICGNPQCSQFIYDPNNCTLSNEQREQIDFYPFTCPHCQQQGYVGEVIECSNVNCQQAERATLFDVDLQVQRLGTKGQQTFLQIFTHSEPRPIQVADPEVLQSLQPIDLLKKFAPTSPEAQAKLFNIPMAGAPQQQAMSAPGIPPMQMQQPMQQQMPMQTPMQQMQQPIQAPVVPPMAPTQQPLMGQPQPMVVQPPGVPAHVQTLQPALPVPQQQLPQMAVPQNPQMQLPMGAVPAAPMPPMAPMPPAAPQAPQAPQLAIPYQMPGGGQLPQQ